MKSTLEAVTQDHATFRFLGTHCEITRGNAGVRRGRGAGHPSSATTANKVDTGLVARSRSQRLKSRTTLSKIITDKT
jgi:hypothetical protein